MMDVIICPRRSMEKAIKFPRHQYNKNPDLFGDHDFTVTDAEIMGNIHKKG